MSSKALRWPCGSYREVSGSCGGRSLWTGLAAGEVAWGRTCARQNSSQARLDLAQLHMDLQKFDFAGHTQWGAQTSPPCLAGRLALAVSTAQYMNVLDRPPVYGRAPEFGLHFSVRRSSEPDVVERAGRLVISLLTRLESQYRSQGVAGLEQLADELFRVLGLDPSSLRFIVAYTHMDRPVPSSPPISEMAPPTELSESQALVFDIGMSSGIDSLFYLQHGWSVVAVEPHSLSVLSGRSRLAQYLVSRQLQILHAAVVGPGSLTNSDGGKSEVSICMRAKPEETSVASRSSDRSQVDNPSDCENTVNVTAVSCASLVSKFGTPFYVKVDVEGNEGLRCLASLATIPGGRPHGVYRGPQGHRTWNQREQPV
ncbi:unnamed protein product [Polarella glacialis]|uniref:Methyltransferase FkbM domain-containing protein n=1 Tax=Polarella glacialis TaxID=89957 RepID=A0A813FM60_POLGL|nr:unnamed protein product [Polarella glacialis]